MAGVQEIASYFIQKSYDENRPISNKKLQKLVYYAQVWYAVHYEKPLFRERIEAWIHGPAIPVLYKKYRQYGYGNIPAPTSQISLGDELRDFLDEVWKVYGKLDANYLEQLTHSERPWQQAREGLELNQSSTNTINISTAKDFYANLLRNASPDTGASTR